VAVANVRHFAGWIKPRAFGGEDPVAENAFRDGNWSRLLRLKVLRLN
jgi:hypothetical protein